MAILLDCEASIASADEFLAALDFCGKFASHDNGISFDTNLFISDFR